MYKSSNKEHKLSNVTFEQISQIIKVVTKQGIRYHRIFTNS